MKKLVLLLTLFNHALISENQLPQDHKSVSFTENKGQFSDQNHQPRKDILYGTSDGSLTVHFKNKGVSYQQYKVVKWQDALDYRSHSKTRKVPAQTTIYRLDIEFEGANETVIEQEDLLPGFNNYYLDVCPNGVFEVKSCKAIRYKNIYNGIDLAWYEKSGSLKYDFIVAAGVSPSRIKLKYTGADKITVNKAGELIITTPLGKITEEAPFVTQNGKKVNAYWKVSGNTVSFHIPEHDPSLSLLIDPGVRNWGTYYGGNADDVSVGCSTDSQNNIFIAGYTMSGNGNFIATVGAHQVTYLGGPEDMYVAKFNSAGVRQWGTYCGQSGRDFGFACCNDASGNVFLCGESNSNNLASPGAHQTSPNGSFDAYIAKFNASGVRQWATYYGGSGIDIGYGCAADATGNIYMTGKTAGAVGTQIASLGAHQTTYYLFDEAFLVKFDPNGVRQWGTYYGENEVEIGYSCTTDASGNVYMAGASNSTANIATPGTHMSQHSNNGQTLDAFIAKFNSSGVRQWGTYYGGNGTDEAKSCVINSMGEIYIAGKTDTQFDGNKIAIDGAHQTGFGGGNADAFLAKFNAYDGNRIWSTYYGGSMEDAAYSCSLRGNDHVYISGYTGSNNFISTPGSHQSTYGGGTFDGFLVLFSSTGQRLWGSYYGGPNTEIGSFCATDNLNHIYLAGLSDSFGGNIIATPGSHQFTAGGGAVDAYVVQFYDCPAPAAPFNGTPQNLLKLCAGNSATLVAAGSGTITWFSNPAGGTPLSMGATFFTPTLAVGIHTFYAQANTCTASAVRIPVTVTVNALPSILVSSNNTTICQGQSAVLTASGATSYTWNGGGYGVQFMVSPTITTTYTVEGTDANGCVNSNTFVQNVVICTGLDAEATYERPVSIYPNPNNGEFSIDAGAEEEATLIITNVLGQVVSEEKLKVSRSVKVELKEKGIYFVNIRFANENFSRTAKVVVQ